MQCSHFKTLEASHIEELQAKASDSVGLKKKSEIQFVASSELEKIWTVRLFVIFPSYKCKFDCKLLITKSLT